MYHKGILLHCKMFLQRFSTKVAQFGLTQTKHKNKICNWKDWSTCKSSICTHILITTLHAPVISKNKPLNMGFFRNVDHFVRGINLLVACSASLLRSMRSALVDKSNFLFDEEAVTWKPKVLYLHDYLSFLWYKITLPHCCVNCCLSFSFWIFFGMYNALPCRTSIQNHINKA